MLLGLGLLGKTGKRVTRGTPKPSAPPPLPGPVIKGGGMPTQAQMSQALNQFATVAKAVIEAGGGNSPEGTIPNQIQQLQQDVATAQQEIAMGLYPKILSISNTGLSILATNPQTGGAYVAPETLAAYVATWGAPPEFIASEIKSNIAHAGGTTDQERKVIFKQLDIATKAAAPKKPVLPKSTYVPGPITPVGGGSSSVTLPTGYQDESAALAAQHAALMASGNTAAANDLANAIASGNAIFAVGGAVPGWAGGAGGSVSPTVPDNQQPILPGPSPLAPNPGSTFQPTTPPVIGPAPGSFMSGLGDTADVNWMAYVVAAGFVYLMLKKGK